jgi:hypothetical protein
MFRRKELQESLLRELAALLAKRGFEFKPRTQEFHASRPDGSVFFHLSFVPHPADFNVIADVAVRFNAVEDLLNEGRLHLSNGEKKLTCTIGCELGQLSGGMQRRWTIASDADIREAAASIYAAFESIGVPFIEQYSDLPTLLAVLSRNDKLAWLLSPSHSGRYKTVLAVAYLLGKYDEIESLIAQSEAYLGSLNFHNSKKEFDDFQRFAARIRHLLVETN